MFQLFSGGIYTEKDQWYKICSNARSALKTKIKCSQLALHYKSLCLTNSFCPSPWSPNLEKKFLVSFKREFLLPLY